MFFHYDLTTKNGLEIWRQQNRLLFVQERFMYKNSGEVVNSFFKFVFMSSGVTLTPSKCGIQWILLLFQVKRNWKCVIYILFWYLQERYIYIYFNTIIVLYGLFLPLKFPINRAHTSVLICTN